MISSTTSFTTGRSSVLVKNSYNGEQRTTASFVRPRSKAECCKVAQALMPVPSRRRRSTPRCTENQSFPPPPKDSTSLAFPTAASRTAAHNQAIIVNTCLAADRGLSGASHAHIGAAGGGSSHGRLLHHRHLDSADSGGGGLPKKGRQGGEGGEGKHVSQQAGASPAAARMHRVPPVWLVRCTRLQPPMPSLTCCTAVPLVAHVLQPSACGEGVRGKECVRHCGVRAYSAAQHSGTASHEASTPVAPIAPPPPLRRRSRICCLQHCFARLVPSPAGRRAASRRRCCWRACSSRSSPSACCWSLKATQRRTGAAEVRGRSVGGRGGGMQRGSKRPPLSCSQRR